MRFGFSDDQLAFRDAVHDLLAKECPAEVVRAAWPESGSKGAGARTGPDQLQRAWGALADMGVLGIAVSDARGGLGLTELDWVLLAEEAGYAALPYPFVETVCVAGPLLSSVADVSDVLDGLLTGELLVAVQFEDTPVVAFGQDAAAFLLRSGDDLHLVRRTSADVAPMDSIDGARRMALVTWDPADAERLVHGDAAEVAGWFDRGALGTAGQLIGLGRRMLELTIAYVKDRRQFGVQIGSFQAIKHHLADVAGQLAFATPAVHRAAWSLAAGSPTAARDVSMAKATASDAAHLAGRRALQCHGAIGYTVEYDLHLYLKRAEALTRAWGDAAWHRRRVGAAIGTRRAADPIP